MYLTSLYLIFLLNASINGARAKANIIVYATVLYGAYLVAFDM